MTSSPFPEYPDRSTALVRGFRLTIRRARLLGALVAVVAGASGGIVIGGRGPLLVAPLVAATFAAVVGMCVPAASVPRPLRRAYEAYSWLGRWEIDRFVERTGGPVPVRHGDIEAWLASHPSTPEMRLPRVELLAFIGRVDEAREELAAGAGETPEDVLEEAIMADYVGWLAGDPTDRLAIEAATARLPAESDDRRAGEVAPALARARARARYVDGDEDWTESLAAVRP
nr:hypothetical protein [Chloroflexota bacterium]